MIGQSSDKAQCTWPLTGFGQAPGYSQRLGERRTSDETGEGVAAASRNKTGWFRAGGQRSKRCMLSTPFQGEIAMETSPRHLAWQARRMGGWDSWSELPKS